MARYTGPKSRVARKFGDPIFGPDKHLERKNFPPGQTGLTRKERKHQNMAFSFAKNRKLNIPMEFSNVSSEIHSKKHHDQKE